MSKLKYIVNPEYTNAEFEYRYFKSDGSFDENSTMLDGRRFYDPEGKKEIQRFIAVEVESCQNAL